MPVKKVVRKRTRRIGGSVVSKLNKIAKDTKVLSTALKEFGNPMGLASAASALGYGKQKRKRTKKMGKGFLGDLLGGIGDFGRAGLSSIGLGKKLRKRTKKMGKGFLGDLIGGIGNFGKSGLSAIGLGKKRGPKPKRKRTKRGGSVLSKLNKIAKDSKIISTALNEFDNPFGLSSAASALGYGKKKKKGGMFVGDMPHVMPHKYHTMGMGVRRAII